MRGVTQERAMPADLEAERALLGALLLEDSGISDVAGILRPDDFFGEAQRRIWAAMAALAGRNESVDVTTLVAELGHDVDGIPGGRAFVSSLIDGMPRCANVRAYARILHSKAAWRSMARLGQEMTDRALAADGDVVALARTFTVDLDSIARAENRDAAKPTFAAVDEGHYRLTAPAAAATLEADFLRRERGALKGQLLVRCDLPGARTFDGVLSVGEYNFSSTRTRQMMAKYLAERSRAKDLPWLDLLEELDQRILAADREGEPDLGLHEIAAPGEVEILDVDGLRLPRRHPSIIFGDGDTGKSYLLLWTLGRLALRGLSVGLADWELTAGDHRGRLGRLFPDQLPEIRYLRCIRPIVAEAERLRRWVRDRALEFVGFDSVAYACAGAPESAEVAMAYFQVVRQLGPIGSVHIAHITKAAEGSDRRPFGSTFWHNSPRATWFAKVAEKTPDDSVVTVGLYPRKFNVGPVPRSVGFELSFGSDTTDVRAVDLADVADLAANLSVAERLYLFLRRGSRTRGQIREHFDDVKAGTLRQTLLRAESAGKIVKFPSGTGPDRYGLVENRR